MSQSTNNSAVPAAILRKLHLVRNRKMLVQFATALVAALAVLLAAMGVAMLIDWLATLYDSRWRFVLTSTALLAAFCTSIGWMLVAWRRAVRLERLAAEVDREVPKLEERWTTMTRLGDDADKPEVVHPAMLRRLSSEASSWEPRIEPQQVVSLSTLIRAMVGLSAVTAVLAVAVVLNSREVMVLVHRFWQPGASISATKLVDIPGNLVIARGEPLALNATIAGTPVENAILFLRPEAKSPQTITLVADRSAPIGFSHRMRSVDEPFAYRFRAGDGQTEWFNVDVADRPEIDRLKLTITPPAYTKHPAKTFDKLPERLSALRDSRLEIAVRAKGPVENAHLKMDNDHLVQLSPGAYGWYHWTTDLTDSFSFTPVLKEQHGLTNLRAPKCQLNVYEDQPPSVKVITPDDRMAVRPEDDIQITFAASDDVGIGSAELVVYKEDGKADPTPIATIPIDLGDQQGSRSVQQTVDLDLKKFGTKDGSEISYEIRVKEDRGDSRPRIASREQKNEKTAKPPQAMASRDANGEKTDKKSDAAVAAATPTTKSIADASANKQAPNSVAQSSQSNKDATSQKNSAQAATSNSSPDPVAKPNASALAADNNPKSQSSPTQESSQQAIKSSAEAGKQSPNPNATPADKNAAMAKSEPQVPSASNLKNGGVPPEPRTATTDRQTVAANANPNGKPQTAESQPAKDAQSANSGTAKDTAAMAKQQPSNAKHPDGNSPQAAKNQSQSPASAQSKNPTEPPAPRTASSGRQSVSPTNNKAEAAQPPQMAQANASNTNPSATKDAAAMKQQGANSKPPANNAAQTAKSESQPPAMAQNKTTAEPPAPRTASSGRQSVQATDNKNNAAQSAQTAQSDSSQNANSTPAQSAAAAMKEQAANQKDPAAKTAQAMKNESKSEKSMAASDRKQSPASNQTASNDKSPSDPSQSTPPPGDDMTRRMLDVQPPQSASSQRMRLKVDQFAGSFEGQRREKLEMVIGPELEALDQKLAKAQRTARGVLDGLESDKNWLATYDREVAGAQQLVVDGRGIVEKLFKQSKDTPYAFVGLQLADVDLAHLEPARTSFWNAIQSKGDDRAGSVRDGWQHLGRARELLKDLRGQFERSRKEFKLAEAVDRAKKMYQVYIENSHALLQIQDEDPDRYRRKIAELKMDDEYLKRLKEVLKMRNDLEAELARILGEDPRLLRRYMDNLRARSNNLREQLSDLSSNQSELNREVQAWSAVTDADRQRMAQLLMLRNVQEADKIATAAGELQDRYQSWLPLQREAKDASLAAVSKKIQEMATTAGELKSQADQMVSSAQKAAPAPPSAAATAPGAAATPPSPDNGQAIDQLLTRADSMYAQLTQLEVDLRQLASRDDQPDVAVFAGNRLVDTRRLIADESAWVRQIRSHKAGSYTGAAEVTQYRLATKAEELTGKLADLEQQLSGLMQRPDGTLPEAMAAKSREFMATMDKEVAPNQLAAVYALHGNQLPRTVERQQLAGAALTKSEKLYDELMRMAIVEMDKLPVQDPIAQLLDDPTLDQLLAQLEREASLQELLGIPARPDNLRIIGDWMRPGKGGGGGGGMQRIALNQMRQNDKRNQQKLKQAYQRAIARALKETKPKRTAEIPKSAKLSDWNRLVSHLGDDLRQGRDKAPPEQYRQAIAQYFEQISRAVAEQDKKSP